MVVKFYSLSWLNTSWITGLVIGGWNGNFFGEKSPISHYFWPFVHFLCPQWSPERSVVVWVSCQCWYDTFLGIFMVTGDWNGQFPVKIAHFWPFFQWKLPIFGHFWSLWSHIWVCCSQHVLGITISLDLDLVNTIYQWKLFITWKLIIFAFLGVKKAPNGPQNENTPSYPQNWSFSYTRTVDFMPLRWSDMGPKRAVWNFLPMVWFTL